MLRDHQFLSLVAAAVLVGVPLAVAPAVSQQGPGDLEQRLARGKAEVLATVGDQTITLREFETTMAERGGELPGQYETVEQRRALLEEMVRQRMLVARAEALGYDEDPDVLAVMRKVMVRKLIEDQLEERLAAVEVTEEEVRRQFDANRSLYTAPERYRTAMIL
ncbi:MAG: hypothetical protein R3324_13290, partial [Halobacteriales archaeon]|nr:hypothetical protein [Halobacteriales archaeon]